MLQTLVVGNERRSTFPCITGFSSYCPEKKWWCWGSVMVWLFPASKFDDSLIVRQIWERIRCGGRWKTGCLGISFLFNQFKLWLCRTWAERKAEKTLHHHRCMPPCEQAKKSYSTWVWEAAWAQQIYIGLNQFGRFMTLAWVSWTNDRNPR